MKIEYVKRELLYPKFGCADRKNQIAYIREDLPPIVKKFVETHELYHLRDNSVFWVWREIKANIVAGIKCPLGFIVCIGMSLVPYRLRYYWTRIMKGK